jgi:phage terminase large subunit
MILDLSKEPSEGFATHDEFLSLMRKKIDGGDSVQVEEPPLTRLTRKAPARPAPNSEPVQPLLVEQQDFTGNKKYEPIEFASAYEFMLTYHDEFELYDWQIEELERLSGWDEESHTYKQPTSVEPMQYSLAAANGSGKDNVLIAGFILWFLATKTHGQVRVTSNTAAQIDAQTFSHAKYYAQKINRSGVYGEELFQIKHLHIECERTGAKCLMFVTNEAGRAEGFHAKFGNPFAVIINEAKSIDDALFGGFVRYTGWTHWIEISSTGYRRGHFYRKFTSPEAISYPKPLKHGVLWNRKIKASDCPHIMSGKARIAEIIRDFGPDSIEYHSAIASEFSDGAANDILIKGKYTEYLDPAKDTYGLPKVAGVDLSLGGDETVVSIWQGNHRAAQICLKERYEPTLHFRLIEIFKEYELLPENIIADAGGLGKPIIHRLAEAGWPVDMFNFGGSARNKAYYSNIGAELWMIVKRLVEEKLIVLPRTDYKLLEQLTSRRYDTLSGKIKLESKEDVRSRGEDSPDRADAMIMAWSRYDIDAFKLAAKPGVVEEKGPVANTRTRPEPVVYNIAAIQAEMERRREAGQGITFGGQRSKQGRGGFIWAMTNCR